MEIENAVNEIATDLGFILEENEARGAKSTEAGSEAGEKTIAASEVEVDTKTAAEAKVDTNTSTEADTDTKTEADTKTEDKTKTEIKTEEEETSQSKKEEEDETLAKPPKTWREVASKEWDKVPTAVKAEIIKREEEMFKGIELYKNDAHIGKALKTVVTPYLANLQAAGIEPMTCIQNLLHAHNVLAMGDREKKIEVFKYLHNQYGISFEGEGMEAFHDPQVNLLQKQIADLQSRIDSTDKRTQDSIRVELQKEVDTFSADPAHPHFELLSGEIAALLQHGHASTLQEAYDKALMLNPKTRELELTRLADEKVKTLQETQKKDQEKLQKASAANLKVNPKNGSGTATVGSMDDTLAETLKQIKSRG